MACVYFIIHLATGRIYVGKTVLMFKRRWQRHLCDSRSKDPTHFDRALFIYGEDAFECVVGEYHETDEQAKQSERYWISYLKENGVTLFNEVEGGGGAPQGTRHNRGPLSEAHKRKLSEIGRGRPKSEEHRRKIGAAHIGRKASELKKQRCREATLRLLNDPEYREKNSAAIRSRCSGKPALNRGVPATEEAKQKNRETQLRNAELRRQKLTEKS